MIELFLSAIIILLIIVLVFLFKKTVSIQEEIDSLKFKKKSQSVRYGKITEQFLPFMKSFPFPSENFRFIGTPIDGLAFNEDKVVFLEFKAADSKLSKKQKHIKTLIKNKKVDWKEINIK